MIVPHLNQPEALAECLAALSRQQGVFLLAGVIVVDNGSHRPPQSVCAPYPAVRLLVEPTPGPGPARNAGARAASGDILAFIDADCFADPGWLAAITRGFADNPQTGILGGAVQVPRTTGRVATALEAYESIYAYRIDHYISRQGFAGTGNLAVRRAVFNAVGPFGGIGISEDRDWGRRATRMGQAIRFMPDMIVLHPARPSFEDLCHKWDRHIAHDLAQTRQHRHWRLRTLLRAAVVAASPLAELPRIILTRRVRGLRERALAFACLLRIRLYRARRMLGLIATHDLTDQLSRWNRR